VSVRSFVLASIAFASAEFGKSAIAQEATPDLITDRPDKTESALVVPAGWLQVETGFYLLQDKVTENRIDSDIKTYGIGTTLLRFGLSSNLELRYASEYLYQETTANGSSSHVNGMGGAIIGSKLQLVRDNPSVPDIAALIQFHLPIGSENFRSQKIEPELIVAAAHGLSDRFALSYNVGGTWNQAEDVIVFLYSTALSIGITDKLAGFSELYGDVSAHSSASYQFAVGATYKLLSNLQTDASAGGAFTQNAPDWFVSVGISVRIPH